MVVYHYGINKRMGEMFFTSAMACNMYIVHGDYDKDTQNQPRCHQKVLLFGKTEFGT